LQPSICQAHVEATDTAHKQDSKDTKMTEQAQIRVCEEKANQYASREDFRRIFSEGTNGLYQLSLLLTRDSVKAEQCFVGGLEDCVGGNSVFRDWARSWAKRAIVQNAIRQLKPRASQSNSPLPGTAVPDINELSTRLGEYFEMRAVLRLEDFERFVFVMSALEHYSEHDCALLLGCSVREIREGRTRALKQMMVSSNTAMQPSPTPQPAMLGGQDTNGDRKVPIH
jgi:DNA-directed RNA polymerase specialized sigma24 family protein